MLIPTKYENLSKNILVLGGDIILLLLNKNNYNIEDLFVRLKKLKDVSLDVFCDTITFLWLVEIIRLENYNIELLKKE